MTCQVPTLSAMTDVSHSKRQPNLIDDAVIQLNMFVLFNFHSQCCFHRILPVRTEKGVLTSGTKAPISATGAEITERARSHRIAGPPEFRSCGTALTLFWPYVSCS